MLETSSEICGKKDGFWSREKSARRFISRKEIRTKMPIKRKGTEKRMSILMMSCFIHAPKRELILYWTGIYKKRSNKNDSIFGLSGFAFLT